MAALVGAAEGGRGEAGEDRARARGLRIFPERLSDPGLIRWPSPAGAARHFSPSAQITPSRHKRLRGFANWANCTDHTQK